jgi:uncharacterized protein YjiS (DUF1127 family)
MQNLNRGEISTAAAVEWRAPAKTTNATAQSRVLSAWAAIARLLRTWRMRELQRRELSTMSPRDFGDLAVPRSLAKDEIRRWPWQKSSPQWSQITSKRGGRYDDQRPDSITLDSGLGIAATDAAVKDVSG